MNGRDEGLLVAAAEARGRANAERTEGNRKDLKRATAGDECFKRAKLYDDLAAWCELEANTYIGASVVLIGPR